LKKDRSEAEFVVNRLSREIMKNKDQKFMKEF